VTETKTRTAEIADRYPQIKEVLGWFITGSVHYDLLAILARESFYHEYYKQALQGSQAVIPEKDLMGMARTMIEEVVGISEDKYAKNRGAAKGAVSGNGYLASELFIRGIGKESYPQFTAVASLVRATLGKEDVRTVNDVMFGTESLARAAVNRVAMSGTHD
jgi:hypothetical protein